MSETRARRVAEQIKKEVSGIIRDEIKDPRIITMISVTGVKVSRDLRHAAVFVSLYGTEEEQRETLQTLKRATGFVRSEIGKRIRLRHTPEIVFYQDDSLEYGARIDRVLKTLREEKKEE